ncbi:Mannose-6-phosphate isomerase [Umbelopsis nana]
MASAEPAIYRLKAQTQCYDWGKLGDISKVAEYARASGSETDSSKPYAELWMGTHPNAPSYTLTKDSKQSKALKDLISANQDLSTPEVYQQYEGDLPFLFKILSIRKALSIQAHPDKTLGAKLFKEFPNVYKDPNHKPEMAIAITPFEALCGFRPLEEIAENLQQYPEFSNVVGHGVASTFISIVKQTGASNDESSVAQNKAALKTLFSALMNKEQDEVTKQLSTLVQRVKNQERTLPELITRLDQQYPGGDIGVFSVLLLNYIKLAPGEAIFLGANEPHAYLSGDCVECMAASDNVVRAGLTPKFKDVKVLVDMLTYRYGSAKSQLMTGSNFGPHSLLYDPPIDEFSVVLTSLNANESEKHQGIKGPSIFIVTRGDGSLSGESLKTESGFPLQAGYVYFVGANVPVTFEAGQNGLEIYRAFTVPT